MNSFGVLLFIWLCKQGSRARDSALGAIRRKSSSSSSADRRRRGRVLVSLVSSVPAFFSHKLYLPPSTSPLSTANSPPKKKTLPKNVAAHPKTFACKDRIRLARAPLALLGRSHRRGGRSGPHLRHVRVGVGRLLVHRAFRVGVGRGRLVPLGLLRDVVARKTTVPTTTRRRFSRSMIGQSAIIGAARRGGEEDDDEGGKEERASERSPAKRSIGVFFCFAQRASTFGVLSALACMPPEHVRCDETRLTHRY